MNLYDRKRLGRAGLTALTAMLLSSTAVVAAPASDTSSSDTIKTIIVTARQRSESLEKVPAQVTAFTSSTIENKGITKPEDFLDAVPNVSFVQTQNAGTSFLVIRGISQARNSAPSAAIVVDGVPMTNPAQFNQEMIDIQQIEVLKGPQGALYGRNAIGGAILITTKKPTDHWEGHASVGYESGPGSKYQGVVSGPLTDILKVRGAVSYFNTSGHLTNAYLHDQVDPVKDLSGRISFLFTPTNNFTADLRLSADLLKTRALYYTVGPINNPAPFVVGPMLPGFNDPNNTSLPIVLDNPGKDDRNIYDGALKLTQNNDWGTLTSITGFNAVREILTGDAYDFKPAAQSFLAFNFGADQVQSQYLNVKTWSQEFRYTSPSDRKFRWIAGTQLFWTDRYISTSTQLDFGQGAVAVYKVPAQAAWATGFTQPQWSFLADSQNQFAWAVYLDTSTSLTDQIELSLNVRYDSDHRENTTKTPNAFLTYFGIPSTFGAKRSHTWDDLQPQAILRYEPNNNLNFYVSYSRGFRSGGFNQTGVGVAAVGAGFDNVGDLFDQETADTFEIGMKSQWLNRRLLFNASGYYTIDRGAYFFAYIATNSTQNLGNIKRVDLAGFDLDATARLTDDLTVNASFGYTNSNIKKFPGASSAAVVGHESPLVSEYTANFSAQYLAPITGDIKGLLRVDYNRIGPTTFVIPLPNLKFPFSPEPNPIARKPVDLVNLRAGIQGETWSLTFWSKNLFDEKYNTEYSTGGFLFPAQPMRWGVDLKKSF
jgi:iron complex outermembrane receptor protein